VLEVVEAFSKACGREIPYQVVERRPGNTANAFADPTKANIDSIFLYGAPSN
jgi:UDP-glucose 4-epimerase